MEWRDCKEEKLREKMRESEGKYSRGTKVSALGERKSGQERWGFWLAVIYFK